MGRSRRPAGTPPPDAVLTMLATAMAVMTTVVVDVTTVIVDVAGAVSKR